MEVCAIGDQIDRILRSQTFAGKAQLRKLLGILSKNIDSQGALSPELVIRELWPDEIKTKRSADVATEMNRLRHALKTYYDSEGSNDPITISLPNRAAGVSGTHDRPWIVAQPRTAAEDGAARDHPSGSQVDRPPADRGGRKKATAFAALCAAVAVAIAAYISIRVLAVHNPPKFGRLDGSTLRIMDADGKELWSKSFPYAFSTDWYYPQGLIWIGDLEGKGHTSVLFVYSPALSQPHSTTLICYSDRGQEKWRWTPGRELPELAGSPATYRTHALGVLRATAKTPPRIVALSQHDPWWPSQIALLDANGKLISEYWHSGGINSMVLADLDGDGREEIIAAGVSEYDHQATLVVLDSDRVFGASTETRPEFQIHGFGVAQERLRLLFVRSDLNRALFQFNIAIELTVEQSIVRFTVLECITPPGCRVWYEFDKNFRLIAAFAGGDEFRSAHEKFYQTGKDAHTLSAEEQAAFQKVRCLVGCKSEFVPVGKLVP